MSEVRVAIAGVGNCASSFVQGLIYYKQLKNLENAPGLMHPTLGDYKVTDIVPVAAFDVDARKVGKDLSEAIFAKPNFAYRYPEVKKVPHLDVEVMMGPVLDGVPPFLTKYVEIADKTPVNITNVLIEKKVDMLLNFLPTGSAKAARTYADAAVETHKGFVNGMPELIVSNKDFSSLAQEKGSPLIGDDVKSQIGATIIHRALLKLFMDRGVKIKRSYQLNYLGNTDMYNLIHRGESKMITKSEALTSMIPYPVEISPGFSFIEVMKDRKTAIFYIEGGNYGDAPCKFEAKLEVEDSPNFAGVVVDAVRCCKIALDRGVGGPLLSASAYFSKHPPKQFPDDEARTMLEEFIAGKRER
ncbi:MAG: inositol-3-phosphate synthase [Actinobacteria bacterium]|nr:inositol-3-phosphate synthase [Actinomycetota bacterium]